MTEFARQFAIRLPDDSLFAPFAPPVGPYSWMHSPDAQRKPLVFDTEAEAQKILDEIKTAARNVGVVNLGAVIVSRVVGPWGDVDLTSFIAAVEGHANGGAS